MSVNAIGNSSDNSLNVSQQYFDEIALNQPHFKLDDSFIAKYEGKKPNFGFNGLGEFVFYRTYSRLKEDGAKETFLDTIRRVVEGCYEIQRRHCNRIHVPWDSKKAQKSAREMFTRMWEFKFLPPGRGLWMMGTEFMWKRGSASLNNCGFVSTDDIEVDPAEPFCFLMDMSMLGVGVGFDTKGAKKVKIKRPTNKTLQYVIDDSREGWVDSLRVLIRSYTTHAQLGKVEFDYSKIRKEGSIINGFGGKASGPRILQELHKIVEDHFIGKLEATPAGAKCLLDSVDITDLMNYIGKCVVAGNVRRCLPKGTLVHLKRGLVPIEKVQVGDLVLTSDGYHPVTENVYQGVQNVLTIKTQMGQFRCTNRHRIAILTDIGQYDWKRAEELLPGDKMVFIDEIIPGTNTTLPGDFSSTKKLAEQPLNVPECILMGNEYIRSVYLAELFDNDDSTSNESTTLASGTYGDFLQQVQTVYSSLGIPTKLELLKEDDENNQVRWELSLVGDFARNKFIRLIQPHAVKTLSEYEYSDNDFDYPSEWITRDKVDYGKSWTPQSTQVTTICEAKVGKLVPVEVTLVVDEGIECETYDLSVPDMSEFVAQGMLVHNTAEIAFGEADDEAYCKMKNPTATLLPEDMSVWFKVTGELYAKQINAATSDHFLDESGNLVIPSDRLLPAIATWNALNSHRWASNNSIFAKIGMDYSAVGAQIAANGEPGLMWLDNMRDYGRMIDGKQPGIDGRVKGGNPCLTGDMRLFTAGGYVSLYDLWLSSGAHEYDGTDNVLQKYGSQKIVNSNGVVDASNVYRTGINVPVYRVTYDDNSHIDATAEHQMITLVRHPNKKKGKTYYKEHRVNLSDLRPGDMVPLNRVSHFGTFHDPVYAELAGWCIGDGSLSPKADGQVRAECTCYEQDSEVVLPRISGLLHELYLTHNKSTNQSPAYVGWFRDQEHFDHIEARVGSNVLGRMLRDDGVRSGDKHNVPSSIWRGTKATIAAFLRGFASADGFVLIGGNGTISARIRQSNKKLLEDCRLLLSQFNIASSVHQRSEESKQLMNDGKGGTKLYNRKAGYELIISGIKQVQRFLDDVGFIQDSKTVAAREWLSTHHGSNNSDTGKYVKVKSIEYLGLQDTYCITEPEDNRIVIEGYQIGQCLEQSLESFELCNLVESFPANHENAEDYMRTLKFAYLYAKTVTLLPTHNPRTNQITLRNRRIGLSQSGIVQAFAKFGRRSVLADFCDAGYNEIRRWDEIYAEWLCVQKSIKVTSIKPSGTVSLVSGATPGIHHPEARTYWRRVRIAKDSVLVDILRDAGFHIEPLSSDPDRTLVVKFAVSDERVRPVEEVSIWEQMQNVVDYQRYWADNQVSCTVKFQHNEVPDIARVLEAYEDQLKGISFLPHMGHGYNQAPYEPCTPEEVAEYNKNIKDADYTKYITEAVGSVYCDGDKCVVV